jgi:hypothetical protein
MPPALNLTGQRFTRLLVLGSANEKTPWGHRLWNCVCDCGKEVKVTTGSLQSGNNKSCGCYNSDVTAERNRQNATHGLSKTSLYQTWNAMLQRCNNPNSNNWQDYGGRGIKVCQRWQTFENFYADMGQIPSPEHTLDRINNNGNYEPSNCRWATMIEQQNNRRSNKIIVYKGVSYTVAELARTHGINIATFEYRLNRGWTIEQAVEIKVDRRNTHVIRSYS